MYSSNSGCLTSLHRFVVLPYNLDYPSFPSSSSSNSSFPDSSDYLVPDSSSIDYLSNSAHSNSSLTDYSSNSSNFSSLNYSSNSLDTFFYSSDFNPFCNSSNSSSVDTSLLSFASVLFLVISTHSSSSALLSFMIVNLGMTICERLRDRSFDSLICFDDLSKHAKCYRQVSLLLGRVPSRDAYSADVFNIHSSLLERSGRLRLNYFGSSITAFPIIETINSDITEYIATNVISITDGQLYMNKRLFLDSIRPAIDSALSVSRIGSNAQCKFVKVVSAGLKNELTSLRIAFNSFGSQSSNSFLKLSSLNSLFSQSHLIPSFLE